MTDCYGVIGYPVTHSKSPEMHNAAFNALKIDACYDKYSVKTEDLAQQVSLFKEQLSGWNVTVPHKNNIIELLDWVDPVALAAQSVNTVINENGKLLGYSTDGYGLEKAIEAEFGVNIKDKYILLVGAGGAAQASAVHFAAIGARKIAVVNRTVSKAEFVTDCIEKLSPEVATYFGGLQELPSDVSEVDIIVQCTSLELDETRELDFSFTDISSDAVCIDMIYNKKTPFLQKAEAKGLRIASGEQMLVYQGAKAFTMWTSQEPSIEVMKTAVGIK